MPTCLANTRPSGTVLRAAHDLRWVRDIGDDLVHNHGVLITAVHLGPVTNEPHWVAVVFDCRDKPTIRFGDSLGAPIPVELLTALTWWLSEHSPNEAAYAKLPIAPQDEGHSCGLLVANALVHFVDDSITLDAPMLAVNLRLESFNRIATWGLEELETERERARAEDEGEPPATTYDACPRKKKNRIKQAQNWPSACPDSDKKSAPGQPGLAKNSDKTAGSAARSGSGSDKI
ncbi:hypothetical protein R3P38DRAFT_3217289 [Favolaschia claudopus]|uniref:Ubiquitin-like protease family profile domain-containing protein n=1 Tax=Favolaschia claudopus TaxID=2862362 RepID=A0AAW0A655_9AGAR